MHFLKIHFLRCINAVWCVKNDTDIGAYTKCRQFSQCSNLLYRSTPICRTPHKCVGPSSRQGTAANCKGLQICEVHKSKRYVDTEGNPKLRCQQKCEETKSRPKQIMSENKYASDNFDNVELHVHSKD